jgi:hypothetical protein
MSRLAPGCRTLVSHDRRRLPKLLLLSQCLPSRNEQFCRHQSMKTSGTLQSTHGAQMHLRRSVAVFLEVWFGLYVLLQKMKDALTATGGNIIYFFQIRWPQSCRASRVTCDAGQGCTFAGVLSPEESSDGELRSGSRLWLSAPGQGGTKKILMQLVVS